MTEKHIIWSNRNLDTRDWKDDYISMFGLTEENYDEEKLYDWMVETNDSYLDDERYNLNATVGDEILAIGDLGLWQGRRSGYKIIESGNLADCLNPSDGCEQNEWYVDENGEFESIQSHHDGTNYLIYRTWKDGIDEEQKENLLEAIYRGTATQESIDSATQKLGFAIGEVYGWNLNPEGSESNSIRLSSTNYINL